MKYFRKFKPEDFKIITNGKQLFVDLDSLKTKLFFPNGLTYEDVESEIIKVINKVPFESIVYSGYNVHEAIADRFNQEIYPLAAVLTEESNEEINELSDLVNFIMKFYGISPSDFEHLTDSELRQAKKTKINSMYGEQIKEMEKQNELDNTPDKFLEEAIDKYNISYKEAKAIIEKGHVTFTDLIALMRLAYEAGQDSVKNK